VNIGEDRHPLWFRSAFWVINILMVATYLILVDAGKVFFYNICKY